jgi:hypothetical protein
VSLLYENKISTVFSAVDVSKQTDVIIDISLKGKKFYNHSLHGVGNEDQKSVVCYNELFDCKINKKLYSCAVLRFKNPTLGTYIGNGIDRNVFFNFCLFVYIFFRSQ